MKAIVYAVTTVYLALVALATATPAWLPRAVFDSVFAIDRTPATTAQGLPDASDVNLIANILMFAPIGLLLVLVLGARRWAVALATSVAFTVTIELVQLAIPSRVADIADVALNAGGAVLGLVAGLLVLRLRSGSDAARTRSELVRSGSAGTSRCPAE